jgi:hypothetical protein
MPDSSKYQLDYRPETYWPADEPTKGGSMNEMDRRLKHAAATGDWSAVHMPATPFALRGGDFVPSFRAGEVEIARISLESATWDVISFRARPTKRGIVYRAVDEYPEGKKSLGRRSSVRPLTLREITTRS